MPSDILTGCISGRVGAMGVRPLDLVHIWLPVLTDNNTSLIINLHLDALHWRWLGVGTGLLWVSRGHIRPGHADTSTTKYDVTSHRRHSSQMSLSGLDRWACSTPLEGLNNCEA